MARVVNKGVVGQGVQESDQVADFLLADLEAPDQ